MGEGFWNATTHGGLIWRSRRDHDFDQHSSMAEHGANCQDGVATSASASSRNQHSTDYLFKGIDAESNNCLDDALFYYTAAIDLNPYLTEALYNRGNIYLKRRAYDQAIADYNDALSQDPSFINAWSNRSTAWYFKGDYDQSIADTNRAINLDPSNALAFCNRGICFAMKGDFDTAIHDYTKALEISPRHVGALRSRAAAWKYENNIDKALADYSSVLDIAPDAECHNDRGLLWAQKGEYEKALADFAWAQALSPEESVFAKNHAIMTELIITAREYSYARPRQPSDEYVLGAAARKAEEAATNAEVSPWNSPEPSALAKQVRTISGSTRRVALLIGNSGYSRLHRLEHPVRDVRLIERSLLHANFSTVIAQTDVRLNDMIKVLQDFSRTADDADLALIYFSGHAIQMSGGNYIIPIDASLRSERDIEIETIDASRLLTALSGALGPRVLVLDACRESTLAHPLKLTSGRAVGRGLCCMNTEPEEVIVFSETAGNVAPEWTTNNSPFAEAFARRIGDLQENNICKFVDGVCKNVLQRTSGQQHSVAFGSSVSNSEAFHRSRELRTIGEASGDATRFQT